MRTTACLKTCLHQAYLPLSAHPCSGKPVSVKEFVTACKEVTKAEIKVGMRAKEVAAGTMHAWLTGCISCSLSPTRASLRRSLSRQSPGLGTMRRSMPASTKSRGTWGGGLTTQMCKWACGMPGHGGKRIPMAIDEQSNRAGWGQVKKRQKRHLMGSRHAHTICN